MPQTTLRRRSSSNSGAWAASRNLYFAKQIIMIMIMGTMWLKIGCQPQRPVCNLAYHFGLYSHQIYFVKSWFSFNSLPHATLWRRSSICSGAWPASRNLSFVKQVIMIMMEGVVWLSIGRQPQPPCLQLQMFFWVCQHIIITREN